MSTKRCSKLCLRLLSVPWRDWTSLTIIPCSDKRSRNGCTCWDSRLRVDGDSDQNVVLHSFSNMEISMPSSPSCGRSKWRLINQWFFFSPWAFFFSSLSTKNSINCSCWWWCINSGNHCWFCAVVWLGLFVALLSDCCSWMPCSRSMWLSKF